MGTLTEEELSEVKMALKLLKGRYEERAFRKDGGDLRWLENANKVRDILRKLKV